MFLILTTTLNLTVGSDKSIQKITNFYNVNRAFKNYKTGLGPQKLLAFMLHDLEKPFMRQPSGSVSVANDSNSTYTFKNYTKGLIDNSC